MSPRRAPLRERLVSHPWLVGDRSLPGSTIGRRARWMTIAAVVLANAVGGGVVFVFALLVLPKPDGIDASTPVVVNVAVAVPYLLLALLIGVLWGRRRIEGGRHGLSAWLHEDRPPTPTQRRRALQAPLRLMMVQMVLWGVAAAGFTVLNATYSGLLALGVGLTVALGGLTTSAATYLLAELAMRPVVARALAERTPDRRRTPGIAVRWLLAWALGTGVPVLGLGLVGIVALTPIDIAERTLAVTMIVLCGIGLLFGATTAVLAAYATSHPIRAIRLALRRVRAGDLDVELGVWDSTEVGLLQAGFNDMVAGLRERERMRDVFGRQVGEDVARKALESGIELGGELRDVAVLFVDITGSTRLASERPAEEVVTLLNRFFAEVVDVVEHAGGWINKFVGDAALAVFGAPVAMDDPEGCALVAARRLHDRLRERVPELQAGIGVASGAAVAGNVGAERRFEYTVIGDPVNEAARLTDLAKRHDPPVLASAATVARARGDESGRWELDGVAELRGRAEPTRLARPLSARDGAAPAS